MEESDDNGQGKKEIYEITTFPAPYALGENQGNLTINTHPPSKPSKEEIIAQAFKFHSEGNIQEAAKCYKYFINQGFKDHRIFSNYGVILKDLGNLKEAELSQRKAIELNPNFAKAHSNLAGILKDLGRLQDAESALHKAIELDSNYAIAYSNLGGILTDLGKLKEAEIYLSKAIELNPNFADAYSNLGKILIELDKLQEAELSTRQAIELNPNLAEAYLNLGSILSAFGKLQDAEVSTRKAIELDSNYAIAYSNLGGILTDLGKLKEAEIYLSKAIEINPNLAHTYFKISNLKYSKSDNKIWQDKLFSKNILHRKSQKDLVYIYFARANVLHKKKIYKESSRYLKLANQLKLNLKPSNSDNFINKSKALLIESDKKDINQKEQKNYPQSIFIVGMPRSGSTLLESILSMNISVDDLGEIAILEESFLAQKKIDTELSLAELYFKKANSNKNKLNITTNKCLYNYQYAGIISIQIPNAKIIHCYRNPLDNILSIYRANFPRGHEYSSSLVDCARVYLDQEEIMTQYKNRFRSIIYDLDYDLLVSNPKQEIKSLISWLGWQWDNKYLSPHLNPRSVSTASNVQVRFPINSKSIGGWKNYKEMLKPAIKTLIQADRYRDLIS